MLIEKVCECVSLYTRNDEDNNKMCSKLKPGDVIEGYIISPVVDQILI